MSFARGAVPLSVQSKGSKKPVTLSEALQIIDGNPKAFSLLGPATADAQTEIVYELPANTRFTSLSVPNVGEVPSPSQTFTKTVEVFGSSSSATDGYSPLASGTLSTHPKPGQVTELSVVEHSPVRWVKLRLSGGILMEKEQSWLEFSEIIGRGTQEAVPLDTRFNGVWKDRGVLIQLTQDGPVVNGCYDDLGELSGTVSGNVLLATGIDRGTTVPSSFVLSLTKDGEIRGVRSTNGAPFKLYAGPTAPPGTKTKCTKAEPPKLGCGAVIHAISFDYDSAKLRSESSEVLTRLYAGLSAAPQSRIVIEGHTSSEGSDQYNLDLSKRRAGAVVADLVARGLPGARISAAGKGEAEPIAKNDDESGRALNRRVEVKCN